MVSGQIGPFWAVLKTQFCYSILLLRLKNIYIRVSVLHFECQSKSTLFIQLKMYDFVLPLQFTLHIISGFVKIWTRFQSEARNITKKVNPQIQEHIIWTNTLTHAENINQSLPDYTIQIWTDSKVSF